MVEYDQRNQKVGIQYNIVNQQREYSSTDSFCDLLNWIDKKSEGCGLEELDVYYIDRLLLALRKASSNHSDFKTLEIQVLELVVNYCLFYKRNIPEPSEDFRKISKRTKQKEYYSRMKKLAKSNGKIRSGDIRLSSLIKEDKMSQLVAELE